MGVEIILVSPQEILNWILQDWVHLLGTLIAPVVLLWILALLSD